MMEWNVGCAAVAGGRHREAGMPCQDRVWTETYDGVTAAALADGAGSAPCSEYGAQAAVRAVCAYMTQHFDEMISNPNGAAVGRGLLDAVLAALEQKAEELETALSDLACTLAAVGIKNGRALLLHIGDGVIGYTNAFDGSVKVLSRPDNGKYRTQTTFVTSPRAYEKMRLYRCSAEKIGSFILMSDGSAESLYQRQDDRLSGVLDSLTLLTSVEAPAQMSGFLGEYLQEQVFPRTDDDCSLLIAARRMTDAQCLGMTPVRQCALYGTDCPIAGRRMTAVLKLCADRPRTVNELCRLTHVRREAVRRRLERLMACGVLTCRQGRYFPPLAG